MPVSSVRVTEGSGPYLHTWQRSVSSVNREEQYIQLGEPALPTFTAIASGISVGTAADHVLQLMAGSTNYVRVSRIEIAQVANATSASNAIFAIYRLTTAGSGGSSVTPNPFDTADTATATAQTLPSSKGTEGAQLLRATLLFRQTIQTTSAVQNDRWVWQQTPGRKPLIIPAGTSNGIAVKIGTGIAGATADVLIEFAETAWL